VLEATALTTSCLICCWMSASIFDMYTMERRLEMTLPVQTNLNTSIGSTRLVTFTPCSWQNVLDTTLCDKVCQWFTSGRWFSPGPPVSSTNKTDRHYINESRRPLHRIKTTNIIQSIFFLIVFVL
jgi:hypothetical protein